MNIYQYQITIDGNFSSIEKVEAKNIDEALRKILTEYANDETTMMDHPFKHSIDITFDRENGKLLNQRG